MLFPVLLALATGCGDASSTGPAPSSPAPSAPASTAPGPADRPGPSGVAPADPAVTPAPSGPGSTPPNAPAAADPAPVDTPGPDPRLPPLLAELRGAEVIEALVSVQPAARASRTLEVYATPTWLVADETLSEGARWAWKDGTLTVDTADTAPRPAGPDDPVTADVVRDLWEAFRAGFPDANWTIRNPEQDGFPAAGRRTAWTHVALPHAWARGIPAYVAQDEASGDLRAIAWRRGNWTIVRVQRLRTMTLRAIPFDRERPEPYRSRWLREK